MWLKTTSPSHRTTNEETLNKRDLGQDLIATGDWKRPNVVLARTGIEYDDVKAEFPKPIKCAENVDRPVPQFTKTTPVRRCTPRTGRGRVGDSGGGRLRLWPSSSCATRPARRTRRVWCRTNLEMSHGVQLRNVTLVTFLGDRCRSCD